MRAVFPANTGQRYYASHFTYVLNVLRHGGVDVVLDPAMPSHGCSAFDMEVDGKRVLVDYSDAGGIGAVGERQTPVFQFHCRDARPWLHAFTPMSFEDWSQFNRLSQDISYPCAGDVILNNQLPYGNATERRRAVRQILTDYGQNVDFELTSQEAYWKKVSGCLVSVHVPGQNNNMLDRGQLQMMAFGCCTISPSLPEVLPFATCFSDGVNYIRCADDYSDLRKKIEWCRANRQACRNIGHSAKALFMVTSTPEYLVRWIKQCLGAAYVR